MLFVIIFMALALLCLICMFLVKPLLKKRHADWNEQKLSSAANKIKSVLMIIITICCILAVVFA